MSAAVKAALASKEWVEHPDKKSGKSYFVHGATRRTVWDLDKELAKAGGAAAPTPSKTGDAAKPRDAAKTLADVLAEGEWSEKKDPKSGKAYYVNKTTKKTTWDLAKDLGLSSGNTSTTAAAKGAAKTLADVLAEGEWSEKKDPKSGKSYYVNKTTKKTTWDLAKDLGLSTAASTDPAASSGAVTAVSVSSQPSVPRTAKEALNGGGWRELRDTAGATYFINDASGEATADLDLYLDIQRAVGDGGGAAELPMAQRQQDDWVNVMLRAPGHEDSIRRLLGPHMAASRDDAEASVAAARAERDEALRRAREAEADAAGLRRGVVAHQQEIHQLQCALFYGLGDRASGYTPAAMDAVSGPSRTDANSLTQRVASLEQLLSTVQGHNRLLVEQLQAARTDKHVAANCGDCRQGDAWQRLLSVADSARR
jgi:uncharacterized protein (DUF2344 family)